MGAAARQNVVHQLPSKGEPACPSTIIYFIVKSQSHLLAPAQSCDVILTFYLLPALNQTIHNVEVAEVLLVRVGIRSAIWSNIQPPQ